MARSLVEMIRTVSGRVLYGLILWVIVFSTLGQFKDLNDDLHWLEPMTFHTSTGLVALVVAMFEAITLKGLSGLHTFFERPDPIPSTADAHCDYRPARPEDLRKIRALALKRYGYAFALDELQRWHNHNPNCFFLAMCEGRVVAYMDAFPISEEDVTFLLAGGREQKITPLPPEKVDATSSFYIASLVTDGNWGALLPSFLKRALAFYARVYPTKNWRQVCAIGYSSRGETLLQKRQAKRRASAGKKPFYIVDRSMLPTMGRSNRAGWSKLLA